MRLTKKPKRNRLLFCYKIQLSGADPEILKRGRGGGALYVDHHDYPTEKILGSRWFKKDEITLETVSFSQNVSISIFKCSPFLSMKSHQFFKIYYCLDKEREKTLIQESMRKEKLRTVRLCFITGYFLKPFQMQINHFFFFISQAHSQRNFCFLISRTSKGETGNGK